MQTLIKSLIAAGLLASALSGCATATFYQPVANGYGYTEQRIEKNRYRITFFGNSRTPKQTVENYLLYRAAELSLQAGYDYFVFASNDVDANTRYQQSFSGYYGYGDYFWYPRAAFGASTMASPITEYEAQANVVMFSGKKRESDVRAFDAREVRANLEAQIVRPPPQQP